jgi:DNA-binding CsgD family transcriptional regulator
MTSGRETAGLLEREIELEKLGARLDDACSAAGGLTIIEGPAGIGKTQLLEAARDLAVAKGMRILSARGSELEQAFAFGVVRQLFEPLLRTLQAEERETLLAGPAELTRPLLDKGSSTRPTASVDPMVEMLHGLYWLCANAAEGQPVAIVLNDLQWADAASLRFLNYLGGRLDGLAIAVLAALRPGETGNEDGLIAALSDSARAEAIHPVPLTRDAVVELVRAELPGTPDREFCSACHLATGGNPFLLRELLRALREAGIAPTRRSRMLVGEYGPEAVARAVLARISRLSGAAVSMARALAVLGDRAELTAAAKLAEVDVATGAEAADLLQRAEVLQPRRELAFVHPIVRSAIVAHLPRAEQMRLHGNAARQLADADAAPERVAAHLLASDPTGDPWAVKVLRDAAHQALGRAAPDSAIAYLSRALNEPPAPHERGNVLGELGVAETLGRRPAAAEHLDQALRCTADPVLRATAARGLALTRYLRNEPETAIEVLAQALNDLGDADPDLSLRIEAQLIQVAGQSVASRALHATYMERTHKRSLGDGLSERFLLAQLAGYGNLEGIPADEAKVLSERALGNGELLEDVIAGLDVFYAAVHALMCSDHLDLADAWLDRALAEARARGSPINYAGTSAFRAHVAYRKGDLVQAEAEARAALELAGSEWITVMMIAVAPLIDAILERGALEEAEQIAGTMAPEWFVRDCTPHQFSRTARARLRIAQGQVREGLTDLLEVGRWCEEWGARNPGVFAWRSSAAQACLAVGDVDQARVLAAEEVELARPLGQPRALGIALRAEGLAEGGQRGIELLREAVAALQKSPARLEYARALADLGAALRRRGQRVDARPLLREGMDIAYHCGATRLVQHAHEELLATGARPRRLMLTGRDSLTPTEARIARMAAEGKTNRAIAQELFVTTKTVETHLGHVYRKLDVNTRERLPEALGPSRT